MGLIEDAGDTCLKLMLVTNTEGGPNEEETFFQIRSYPEYKLIYKLKVRKRVIVQSSLFSDFLSSFLLDLAFLSFREFFRTNQLSYIHQHVEKVPVQCFIGLKYFHAKILISVQSGHAGIGILSSKTVFSENFPF